MRWENYDPVSQFRWLQKGGRPGRWGEFSGESFPPLQTDPGAQRVPIVFHPSRLFVLRLQFPISRPDLFPPVFAPFPIISP